MTRTVFMGNLPEYPDTHIHYNQPDLYCLQELYKIYNDDGTEETEPDNKSS